MYIPHEQIWISHFRGCLQREGRKVGQLVSRDNLWQLDATISKFSSLNLSLQFRHPDFRKDFSNFHGSFTNDSANKRRSWRWHFTSRLNQVIGKPIEGHFYIIRLQSHRTHTSMHCFRTILRQWLWSHKKRQSAPKIWSTPCPIRINTSATCSTLKRESLSSSRPAEHTQRFFLPPHFSHPVETNRWRDRVWKYEKIHSFSRRMGQSSTHRKTEIDNEFPSIGTSPYKHILTFLWLSWS